MSITTITKRIAVFLDDKGEYLGSKGFDKTAKTFSYAQRSFNVFHEKVTFIKVKRWYWNLEIYFYNINNPNPLFLDKKCEPIMDSEMYHTQLESRVAKQLNDAHREGFFQLNWRTILIGLGIVILIYLLLTKQIKL